MAGNTLSIEDGNSVDLSGYVSTDDQNISGSGLSGTDLTIGIENGGSQVVDLSSLANTDEQDLSSAVITPNESVEIQITNGSNTTIDIRDADSDITNELTLIGSGAPVVVPSNSGVTYVDDVAGQLYVYDGSAWNAVGGNATPDLDGDPTNERNTAFAINGANLEITDSGGTLGVPLSSLGTDDQALSLAGNTLTLEDGGTVDLSAYLDDTDTDDQNLNLTGTTLSIEDGNSVDLSGFVSTDDQALSLAGNTLTLEDGGSVDLSGYVSTDDQNLTLAGNTLSIEDGNNVDLSGYLDNTDDQNLTGATLTGNTLQIDIENGTSASVDLSALDNSGTDDQALSLAGNTLTLEDGGSVDLSGYVSTDDQNLTGATLTGNTLQIDIENGTSASVDLSALDNSGTDDQALSLAGNTLTLEDGGSVDLSGYVSTDDQNLTLAGNTLSIEDGNNVDLSGYLDNTDDQNISGSALLGTDLTIGIENGTSETIDLSSLVGTDDQNLSLVGNTLGIEDGNNVDLSGYLDNTDEQDLSSAVITPNESVEIQITNGSNTTIDIRDADSDITNELTLIGSGAPVVIPSNSGVTYVDDVAGQLYVYDGSAWNAVGGNATPDLDGDPTNERNTAFAINGANLEITDSGGTLGVPLSNLGTDDQALSLAGNTLTLEDGGTVDLSAYLDDTDTDDQNLNLTGTTLSIEDGNSVDLSGFVSTDDQALSLAGNTLTLEDGGSVDLSGYVSTDDQNIQNLGLVGTTLTVGIESGTSQTVDLASLVGTDDQALSLAGNTLTLEDGGSVDLSGYVSTDDQNLTLAGNTLSIEDGNNVDLSGYLDNTDDQNLTGATLTGNTLQIDIENGTSASVDLSALDNSGTDDQALSLAGNTLTLEDGGSVDLSAYLDDTDTDDQTLSLAGNTLTLEDGGSVDLSGYVSTDDQNLTGATLTGNSLQIDIENGASATVDLSSLVGTDNQTLSSNNTPGDITISGGNNITLNVDDADATIGNEVTNATDATLIRSGLGTTASPYTLDVAPDGITNAELADNAVQLENLADGTLDGQVMQWDGATSTWTLVDLGSVTVTENDGVIGNEVTNATDGTLVRSGAGTTVSPYTLDVSANGITNAEIADDAVQLENIANGTAPDQIMQWNGTNWILVDGGALSTDDQNLTLAGNTLSIEDGNNVDLSGYLDNTDDQNLTGATLTGNTLQIDIENGSSASVDLSSIDTDTDDQTLSLAGNTLSIADGNSVDLSGYVSTDDQALSLAGNTLTLEDGGSVDLSGYVSTDDQNLTLAGNTLSIEDGNNVDFERIS